MLVNEEADFEIILAGCDIFISLVNADAGAKIKASSFCVVDVDVFTSKRPVGKVCHLKPHL